MKLATWMKKGQKREEPRLGILLDDRSMLDLQPAAAIYLREIGKEKRSSRLAAELIPMDMGAFLGNGEEAMNLARLTVGFMQTHRQELAGKEGQKRRKENKMIHSLDEIRFKPPVHRPGKIIAMGLNFHDHAVEIKASVPQNPRAFLMVSSALIGHGEPVPYPAITRELDYEVELAVVIGRKGKDIPPDKAYEHIAGYTILNDLSARDIQRQEAKERALYLSKNLDALGPMGPYLVARDEIADPQALTMELYVNQEPDPRQKSTPAQMIFKIPELVAYWSQMTLEPGDVISSGTPAGVAVSRQPDPGRWFLKRGDIVEARIQRLGVLRNPIV
jgi:2-keto-4-pentenoate hydratase/2-oxohepta-3-ene-1,7-dioic acid hydratase in catechol pathway